MLSGPALHARLLRFASLAGLARVTVRSGPAVIADVGDRSAIAPGTATLEGVGRSPVTVTVSTSTALEYAHDLASSPSTEVVVLGAAKCSAHPGG